MLIQAGKQTQFTRSLHGAAGGRPAARPELQKRTPFADLPERPPTAAQWNHAQAILLLRDGGAREVASLRARRRLGAGQSVPCRCIRVGALWSIQVAGVRDRLSETRDAQFHGRERGDVCRGLEAATLPHNLKMETAPAVVSRVQERVTGNLCGLKWAVWSRLT